MGLRFCARAFSSCGERGPLLIAVRRPLTVVASPVVEHRLQTCRLSNCGSRAQLLRSMWDPPRPGLEPVSPASAGRLSTTAPRGKPHLLFLIWMIALCIKSKNTLMWVVFKKLYRASLVAQWLRIRLPMQGTRVWALVREDPTCRGATKPVCHNYWASTLEPTSHNHWTCKPQLLSLWATTTEAHVPRACAPHQEKPPQWEAHTPQRRVAPARHN